MLNDNHNYRYKNEESNDFDDDDDVHDDIGADHTVIRSLQHLYHHHYNFYWSQLGHYPSRENRAQDHLLHLGKETDAETCDSPLVFGGVRVH